MDRFSGVAYPLKKSSGRKSEFVRGRKKVYRRSKSKTDVPKAYPCGICTLGMIHRSGGECGHFFGGGIPPQKKGGVEKVSL